MSDFNQVTLIGRVSIEPKYTAFDEKNGVLKFSIATEKTWRDKESGEERKKTQFNSVDVFGAIATIAKDHIKVGMNVTVIGELQTNSWDGDNGKQYRTSVVVDNFNHVINWQTKPEQ